MDRLTKDLIDRLARAEARIDALERTKPIPRYATIGDAGAFGQAGRLVFVEADGKLYRDTGAAWKSSDQA